MNFALRCLVLALLCCCSQSITLSAQGGLITDIEAIKEIESDEERLDQYHKLLTQEDTSQHSRAQGILYHELGLTHLAIGNNEAAIDFFQKAIKIRKEFIPTHLKQLNESRYELAKLFKNLRKADKQYQVLQTIIDERGKDESTCFAHADIASVIARKGDYLTALQYLNSALADRALTGEVHRELIIRLKIIFIYALKYGDIFEQDENNPEVEVLKKHQAEVERKFERSGLKVDHLYKMYNNLSIVYEAYGALDIALDSYTKCMHFYWQQKDTLNALYALTNIGLIYSKQKKYKQANECYWEIINKSSDPEQIATAYVDMGYFIKVDSTQEKIPYYFKAFDVILNQNIRRDVDSFALPGLKQIRESNYEPDILIYLIDLAGLFTQSYKENHETYYLHKAKEVLDLIDQLVSLIRYESLSEQSKLFWIEKGVDTYMLGVEVCYLLDAIDEAFYFMEKNKALLLQENIKTLQARWKLDVSTEILEREYALYYQRLSLYEKLQSQSDDIKLKKVYTLKNEAYLSFMDSLKQTYPSYTKTKEQIQITPLNEASRLYSFSDEKCFVEYILNEKDGYGIFCSTTEQQFFKIPDVPALHAELTDLKHYLIKPILDKTSVIEFRRTAQAVFNKLFPFPDALNKLSGKEIVIIPDYTLQHIPFEALTVNVESSLGESYLINFSEISYLQSISVFQQIQQKKNAPNYKLLGIGPHEFQIEGLSTLSGTRGSMDMLSEFKSTKILFGEDATKSTFFDHINNYEIIHLNTHAGLDSLNQEPWLAFRKEKLTLNELYGVENQASLIVLDACKTNEGKLASGEGLINLSRGFFYNGTQSVLAAMWNVNERSGNKIMQGFYDHLQDGRSKSKALQAAKITYLKTHQHSEILPYYWASYTLTGSAQPIVLSYRYSFLKYILITLLLVVPLLYLWYKR
ncbi:MAG: CHAT domain-containing protein [Chitinophagales bacterium]|nr:CHAT domain-containing protein [Chitinophagales bacterium]